MHTKDELPDREFSSQYRADYLEEVNPCIIDTLKDQFELFLFL